MTFNGLIFESFQFQQKSLAFGQSLWLKMQIRKPRPFLPGTSIVQYSTSATSAELVEDPVSETVLRSVVTENEGVTSASVEVSRLKQTH